MTDLEKAARMALKAMGLIGADLVCDAAHHKKADRHGIGEPCPIQARWHHAFAALLQALSDSVEKPAQQEPVACIIDGDLYHHHEIDWEDLAYQGHGVELLYTRNRPAAWIGLTEEEIAETCGFGEYTTTSTRITFTHLARAIEAKLKEKNS